MRAGFLSIITSEMTIELAFKNELIVLISHRSLKINPVQIMFFYVKISKWSAEKEELFRCTKKKNRQKNDSQTKKKESCCKK